MYLYIQTQNDKLPHNNPYSLLTLENIVEESLRMECPFPYCARVANEDIPLGDKLINKGDRIILFISSGNRDRVNMKTQMNAKNDRTPLNLKFWSWFSLLRRCKSNKKITKSIFKYHTTFYRR